MDAQTVDPVADDEYEYQYDDTETETFLVDVDLTSLHGLLLSHGPEDDDEGLQIVDLGSDRPMVLYRSQLYSCSWADMIGTSMFFSAPSGVGGGDDDDSTAALRSDVNFTLLGTSHIKLVGQQGSLVPKSMRGLKRARSWAADDDEDDDDDDDIEQANDNTNANNDDDDDDDYEHDTSAIADGASLPGFSSTNWRTNIARRRQADFLDRLMQAKRSRGETAVVPTVGSGPRSRKAGSSTGKSTEPQAYRLDGQAWARLTLDQRIKLANLSSRVVKGDARAVTALRETYAELVPPAPEPGPEQRRRLSTEP